jgi:hypothetical protein
MTQASVARLVGEGKPLGRGLGLCDHVSLAGTKHRIVPLIGERHTMPRAIGFEVP